jgi:surface polysaccharide O-acyltransferase-like enzyme
MPPDTKPPFLAYLHSFRGFAIINIVAIHAIALAVFNLSSGHPIKIGNELLFHNSTIYFALISGLLFTAVLKEKGYQKFYWGKVKYVLLPYVFFTLVFTVFIGRPAHWFELQPNLESYLKYLVPNFIYGKADFVFWYIPVLFFLYLVTPLLDFLLNIKKWGPWLMGLIIATPLLVRRVELGELIQDDFLPLQNMIYFTGAYAAGMLLASKLEEGMQWIRKQRLSFLLIAILSSCAILYAQLNNIDRMGMFSVLSSLFYIQKLTISGLVLVLLHDIGDQQPGWLQPMAKSAFSIYFLHAFFLTFLLGWFGPVKIFQELAEFNGLLAGCLILPISIGLCLIVAWVFRKIFGKYSRMIVGT